MTINITITFTIAAHRLDVYASDESARRPSLKVFLPHASLCMILMHEPLCIEMHDPYASTTLMHPHVTRRSHCCWRAGSTAASARSTANTALSRWPSAGESSACSRSPYGESLLQLQSLPQPQSLLQLSSLWRIPTAAVSEGARSQGARARSGPARPGPWGAAGS